MTTIRFAMPVLALAALLTPAAAGHARAPHVTAIAVPVATPQGRALELPGAGTSTAGGFFIGPLSCASAGNCAAGGFYTDASGGGHGFVVSQRNGVWRRAIEVPGLGALNKGGNAAVNSVSCASAGNCAAGGSDAGFVVSERNGVWRRAVKMPGPVVSVSCPSAGNCVAAGDVFRAEIDEFLVSQRHGVWLPALYPVGGKEGAMGSVACASAGNCVAGGYVFLAGPALFLVSERHGVWQGAIGVPGLSAVFEGETAVNLSCPSVGNCAADGFYEDESGLIQRFVISQRNGVWRQAIEVPGLDALESGRAR